MPLANKPEPINRQGIELARSYGEVAQIMTDRGHPMTRSMVQGIEKSAMRKLAAHPEFRELARMTGLWD